MSAAEAVALADGFARVIHADARFLPLPDDSVDLVLTSPPYFALRSYQDGGEHYAGQIGSEPSGVAYIDSLIDVTRECLRVLKPSGSLWVNLGDKYNKRSLMLLPQRFAIRCTDDLGLTVREEVVWDKPNPYIDAKASDRFRRTHETWLHLSPSRKPYSDANGLAVAPAADYTARPQYRRAQDLFAKHGFTESHRQAVRSVGNIDTEGGQVRSGGSWTSEAGRLAAEVAAALGSYYRELCGTPNRPQMPGSVRSVAAYSLKPPKSLGLVGHFASFPLEWPVWLVEGWCPPGGTVLDPFGGTGATALAAKALGRNGISVDMSADYCRLAEWRVADPAQIAKARSIASRGERS